MTATVRSNEELIDIAASVTRPRIDMVVFVVVEEKLRSGKYLDKAGVSLSARVINVQSGQLLDAVEHHPKPWSLPAGCMEKEPDCAANALNKSPMAWGRELAALLLE